MKKLRAFTLLEIVMALAIFAIGMVGILSLFPVSFGISKRAADLTEATILAQEKIGELKRDGYDNLPVDGLTESFNTRFTWTFNRKPISAGLEEIKLVVSWTEGGKSYSEDFGTYIADLTPD